MPDIAEEELEIPSKLAGLESTSIEEGATELNSMANEAFEQGLTLDVGDEDEHISVVEVDLATTNLHDLSEIVEQLSTNSQAYDLSELDDHNAKIITDKAGINAISKSDESELLLPGMISEDSAAAEFDAESYAISVNTGGVEQKLLANRGDADPDVLEIFIEEAEEELEKINLNRTIWKDDENNEDALIIIRRSFHSLKGGGRMIGAEIIGEYACQLETILNKVIDKSLVVTIDLHDLIENAVVLLNDLVFQLKTDREPVADVVSIYTAAQCFLENKKNIDDDSSKNELAKDELDKELYTLFLDEAKQHIDSIEQILESKKEHKILPIDDKLLYALHTLFGCSRTAQVDAVSKLIGRLDKYCQECNKENKKLKAEQFDIFVACIEYVKQCINENADTLKYPAVSDELLQKVNNLKFVEIPVIEDVIANVQNDIHVELEPASELQNSPEHELGKTQRTILSDTNITANEIYEHIDVYEGKDTDLVDIFLEEASDILETCNRCLEKWRTNHKDASAVSEFRRQLHTLKGSARMATYINIGDFSHAFETFVINIAESRIEASDVTFNFVQRCLDHMNVMVDLAVAREAVLPAASLIAELETIQAGEVYSKEILPESKSAKADPQEIKTESEVKPDQDLDASSKKNKGEKKAKKTVKIPVLRNPANLSTQPVISGQQSVRLQSSMLDNLVNNAGEVNIFQARLEQVSNNYNVNIYELEQVVDRLREQLRNLEIETETQILSRHAHEVPEQDDFDPLELDRYSNIHQLSRSLAESVNDLLIIKDILSDQVRESELLLSQQRRISGDLQAGLMRTRMVQFNQLIPRLQRIVRQTSRELKKGADLKVIGQNTEVDSSILNRIVAPLEHLVRNAISHGIEEAEQREKVNKPKLGEIKIDVTREGAEIVIIVSDDGDGLDVERIKNKAMELGLIDNHKLSEREALNLILTPGFSTAGKVSQVSGRGVGMDVVASELKQLGGSLQIDSVFGQGAKFVIRIPITLAITQSLLIKCGNGIYAVPLANVEGVVRLSAHELKQKQAENIASYHYADRDYRLCHLGSLLEVCQPQLSGADKMFPVLLVRSGDSRMAVHVEAILGNREIVVKPLAPQLSRLPAVSGATILGDGNVVLILDIQGLIRIDSVGQTRGVTASTDEIVSNTQSTIMVVDDSITIRNVTTRFLERNNYNVVTAKDGVDAVQKLQDFTPALILLDIEMPRMDGYELATHVRNNERLKNVPIIMITSRTGDKHRQRAMDIGVQEYLGKPYNENELLSYVQSVVERKQCH